MPKFDCIDACGNKCCKNTIVCLTGTDMNRLWAAMVKFNLGHEVGDFIEIISDGAGKFSVAIEVEDYKGYIALKQNNEIWPVCIFLKDNRCSIYDYRPITCRFYPLNVYIDDDGKKHITTLGGCPGVGIGEELDHKETIELVRKFTKEMFEYRKFVKEWNKKGGNLGDFLRDIFSNIKFIWDKHPDRLA